MLGRHRCCDVAPEFRNRGSQTSTRFTKPPPVTRVHAPRIRISLGFDSIKEEISDNRILSYRGVALLGRGFVLPAQEVSDLIRLDPSSAKILRPFRNGRDLTDRSRDLYVIDFGMAEEGQLREYPIIADWN